MKQSPVNYPWSSVEKVDDTGILIEASLSSDMINPIQRGQFWVAVLWEWLFVIINDAQELDGTRYLSFYSVCCNKYPRKNPN